jgi:hypothetical protein
MIIGWSLLYVVMFIVALIAAANRNRSVLGCFISNIVFTPLISILILLALGNNKD